MKKFIALFLSAVMAMSLFGCSGEAKDDPSKKSEGVMTYAEYAAAPVESQVTVETYVQAKQSDRKSVV